MKNNVVKNIFVWSMIILLAFSSGIFLAQMYFDLQDTNSVSADLPDPDVINYHLSDSSHAFTYKTSKTTTSDYNLETNYFTLSDISSTIIGSSLSLHTQFNLQFYYKSGVNTRNGFYLPSLNTDQNSTVSDWFTGSFDSSFMIVSNKQLYAYYVGANGWTRITGRDIWYALSYTSNSEIYNGFQTPSYVEFGYYLMPDANEIVPWYLDPNAFGTYTDDIFYISYVDVYGNALTYFFAVNSNLFYSDLSMVHYTNRYYFGNVDKSSIDYSAGYQDGSQDSFNLGYEEGYDDAYNIGYNVGHNQGILDSNEYSFLGLLGAVVDAPISAFTGLFNFELLGINLKDFLAGLFTICIVIVVVRLILVK